MWLPILLVLAGVGLATLSFPVLYDWFQSRCKAVEGDQELIRLAEEIFADKPMSTETLAAISIMPDECRPIESAADKAELDALVAFVQTIETGLVSDDPGVWPDPDQGRANLAMARGLMDLAEQTAERTCDRADGGKATAEVLDEAVRLMLEAKEHWTSGAACRAELSRAVWIRSRGRQHRYRKAGLAAVLRLANSALEREPRNKEASVMRARAQVGLGKLDQARAALIHLMGRHSDDPEVLRTRSRWLMARGDLQGACRAVVDVLETMPEGLAAAERLRVGPALMRLDRCHQADEVYNDLMKWDDTLAEVWAGHARCRLTRKDYEAAAAAARRSLEIEVTAAARATLRKAMVGLG
ncbi:MAG: tetratricopeptide repeat protein [Proteobacteria bacterium]|nr:tetratricopeptide repeat protein [Pseudomonadota bacterium]